MSIVSKIKAYIRRTKSGKSVKVKAHTRKKEGKSSAGSGEEFKQKLEEKKQDKKMNFPPTTPEEIAEWDRKARENSLSFYKGSRSKPAPKVHDEPKKKFQPPTTPEEISEWDRKARENSLAPYKRKPKPKAKPANDTKPTIKKGVPEKIEDRIAKFVEKYSGKTYKRQL